MFVLELNDNRMMRRIVFLQTTALRNGLASPGALMRYSIHLILFLVVIGIPRQMNAVCNDAPKPASARLTVWVPSGVVGSNYWIYVNGHIVSAPPHPPSDTGSAVVASKGKKGWEILNQNGLVLREIHDDGWDRDFSPYDLDAESRDALHLFQPVELPLSAGKYNVDIAVLLPGPFYKSSFPFVISAGWEVDIEPGKPKQLYLSIPDAWENSSIMPASPAAAQSNKACPGKVPSAPNREEAKQKFRAYKNDPIAIALRAADARLSQPKGAVLVDLPPKQGGPREFDGAQILAIVAAISEQYDLPSESDIQDCQRQYPQFSKSYAQYGDVVRLVNDELESFRKLAASLKQSQ